MSRGGGESCRRKKRGKRDDGDWSLVESTLLCNQSDLRVGGTYEALYSGALIRSGPKLKGKRRAEGNEFGRKIDQGNGSD